MTALVARQPLQTLSMSSSQRAPRRLSSRLQEKDDAQPKTNGYHSAKNDKTGTTTAPRTGQEKGLMTKKRKMDHDEEDDGFVFTRANARKTRSSTPQVALPVESPVIKQLPPTRPNESNVQADDEGPAQKRRKKMSFSTPNIQEEKPVRRSKRLSDEHDQAQDSPEHKVGRRKPILASDVGPSRPKKSQQKPDREKTPAIAPGVILGEAHSATKIALPFADTPVIRRNKAMREGKTGKGERRSSLGLRGRRASSLIDSGTSNALPHNTVEADDFYKHIESDGLAEPRRMRQLLTWCATRAMGDKPTGQEFEDHSARMAARVIQEELLKDFANRSEMSDWFSREDLPKKAMPLIKRANPKNIQNAEKIQELEQQITRLQNERKALETLLRPPSIPPIFTNPSIAQTQPLDLDRSLLSPSDLSILNALSSTSKSLESISPRVNSISASLQPTIDAFADGIHQIAQYRDAADSVAGTVLKLCAVKLENRENEGRRRALGEGATSKKDDIGGVLRSLAKLEQ